ncbi:MAG TPA: ATP-binding cassette domain-containing protein [Aggregatilineales bacterium]|nr:ATP-binding cassette domain-containing protein [Aggregatilineales bacterium]
MIHVEHLAKRFKRTQAVADVSFEAHDGEVLGLLGPNGAGKTTTLRILSTVIEPDRGTATVGGYDIRKQKALVRANLGILVENAGLYRQLTARECLRYVGQLHGVDRQTLEARIEALSAELDMKSFIDRPTQGFSRGMTRKVVMGMALVHDPHNVVFDEPTAGLDVMSTRAVRDMIRRLKDEGRCVVLSTHLMDEVERLCDRVAIIHRGVILATGTPADLQETQHAGDLETAFVRIVGEEALKDDALHEQAVPGDRR